MKCGHQVTLAGLGRPSWESLPANVAGAEYVSGAYLPKRNWFSSWELDSPEMLCARVIKHLRQHNYDIVHCLGWSSTNINVFWAGMVNGARTLYTATSTADKAYPADFEQCGLLLNGVHGPARSIAETIGQRMHNSGKCYVFPSCPDRLREPVDLLPGNDYSLGFMGHLEAHKQVERLVRVWAEVCKRLDEPHLHIFGNGSQEDSLREQARQLELDKRITFHGYEANLTKVYSQVAAMIVMAKEGLSLTTVEALCAGRPVILPRDGCFPEIYGESMVSQMYEPDATDSEVADTIVEALVVALDDSAREAARDFFEEKFSSAVVCDHLINCYQDLLGSANSVTD